MTMTIPAPYTADQWQTALDAAHAYMAAMGGEDGVTAANAIIGEAGGDPAVALLTIDWIWSDPRGVAPLSRTQFPASGWHWSEYIYDADKSYGFRAPKAPTALERRVILWLIENPGRQLQYARGMYGRYDAQERMIDRFYRAGWYREEAWAHRGIVTEAGRHAVGLEA